MASVTLNGTGETKNLQTIGTATRMTGKLGTDIRYPNLRVMEMAEKHTYEQCGREAIGLQSLGFCVS